jgi:2-amino-4-hydroxy-6-hydroxymethyldihydropteridine diphosphokinase
VLVLLGFGGNRPGSGEAFCQALRHLASCARLDAVSRAWKTAAVGPPQPDYLNAAVVLELHTHPLHLLEVCQHLEAQAGRDRRTEPRWGPRVLDLDLLLVPDVVLVHPRLSLPHPRLHQRAFALLPACEVAGDWFHPRRHTTLHQLLSALDPGSSAPVHLPGWPAGAPGSAAAAP